MSRPPYECGRLVVSLKGRDAGRAFIIMKMENDDYAFVADGDLRKVESPKKKKTKHLIPKPEYIAIPQVFQNSDVRKAIKSMLDQTDRTNNSKEGCALVKR